jgi:hypothetical protein
MNIRFAAVLYAALTLALAAFAGTALAGNNGNGNGDGNGGNSANAPGQQDQAAAAPAPAAAPAAAQPSTPAPAAAPAHGNSTNAPGHTKHESTAGVKPTSTTAHGQHNTTAPASSNQTKLYGNGKTAGQIATASGHGDAILYGPGNSQPHKAKDCRGHYVDVHALKAQDKQCAPAQTQGTQETQSTQQTQQSSVAPCVATKTITEQASGGVEHFIGPKGSGRFVVIHPSTNSAHYRDKHPDVILPSTTVTKVATETSTTCATASSSTPSAASATVQTASATVQTQAASTTSSAAPATSASTAAPANAAAPAAGGVLGAVSPLASTKPHTASGGVLGAVTPLGRSVTAAKLPFTGLKLWIFALVALSLIGIGLAARRATAQR